MTKNSEYNVWNKINLKQPKRQNNGMTAPKKNNIQITNGMYTKEKKGKLHLKHLACETSIDIPDVKTVHYYCDAGVMFYLMMIRQ